MTLKSKAEFAKMCDVTQAAISKACKPGNALFAAMIAGDGRRLDIEHQDAIDYLDKRRHKSAVVDRIFDEDLSEQLQVIETSGDDEYAIDDYEQGRRRLSEIGERPLNWIIARFGTAEEFVKWGRGLEVIEKVRERRIKNEERLKQLVSVTLIKMGILGPVGELCSKLMTDAVKTMSIRLEAKFKSGGTVPESEEYMRKTIGQYIKPMKKKIASTIGKIVEESDQNGTI
jgi:hypothetical protein